MANRSDLVSLDDIARWFECSPRHVRDLKRERADFPQPVPVIASRKLWFRKDDVRQFRDRLLGSERNGGHAPEGFEAGLNASRETAGAA